MIEYYEGMNCKCMARNQDECACDGVDWMPKEVYEIRKKVAELEKENWQCSEKLYDAEGIMNELKEELVEINRQLNLYKDNELIRESLLSIVKGGDL